MCISLTAKHHRRSAIVSPALLSFSASHARRSRTIHARSLLNISWLSMVFLAWELLCSLLLVNCILLWHWKRCNSINWLLYHYANENCLFCVCVLAAKCILFRPSSSSHTGRDTFRICSMRFCVWRTVFYLPSSSSSPIVVLYSILVIVFCTGQFMRKEWHYNLVS